MSRSDVERRKLMGDGSGAEDRQAAERALEQMTVPQPQPQVSTLCDGLRFAPIDRRACLAFGARICLFDNCFFELFILIIRVRFRFNCCHVDL